MRHMKLAYVVATVVALSLASPGMAPARADAPPPTPLCATLKRIVAATSETPQWKTVRRGAVGTAIPAPLTRCSVMAYSGESQYSCTATLTATTVKPAYAKLAADVTACLGTTPTTRNDGMWTSADFKIPGGPIEVSVGAVEQPGANNYGLSLTVIERF